MCDKAYCQIKNSKNGELIAERIKVAKGFLDRLLGLMFSKNIKKMGNGLLLFPCNSIHTSFMRYAIDVVFISKDGEVLKIYKAMKPWRMSPFYFKAYYVLEMEAHSLNSNLLVGDKLEIQYV